MSKKNDRTSIGDIYGSMLNGVKHKIVTESKHAKKPKHGEIGEAPLLDGGPSEKGGWARNIVDKRNSKKENMYNIDKLSYDEDNEEKMKKHPTKKGKKKLPPSKKKMPFGKKVEDEEKDGKMVKESINNFMRKKSIFDKLYENVMNPGPLGGGSTPPPGGDGMDDADELDALGIEGEDDMGDDMGGDDQVTLTMDRGLAQQFCDMLQAAIGGGDDDMSDLDDDMGDDDMSDDFGDDDMGDDFEEDEENRANVQQFSKEIDYGKNNKVGNLKTQSGGAHKDYTNKVGDDGDHGHALHGAKEPNYGKNNKVSKLKTNRSMFEQ